MRVRVNGLLPLDAAAVPEGPAEVLAHAGAAPDWDLESADPGRFLVSAADNDADLAEVAWMRDGAGIRLRSTEGATFWISRALDEVWLRWRPPLTEVDAAHFLLQPVLTLLLRLRGDLVLHASGVVFGNFAAIVCGHPGAGKSTAAGACLRAGASLLSDDAVRVEPGDRGWIAHPGNASCRVWDKTAGVLLGDHTLAPEFSATWRKRVIRPAQLGARAAASPARVGVVCVLGDRTGEPEPALVQLRGFEAVQALIPHTMPAWLQDGALRAREMRALAALAASVPVVRLVVPRDPAALPLVADLVRDAAGV
ncbi:MAG: hypothetical protein IT356_04150 [Gemmatimonadaceae bacterium]|nr:hypothetical protein [Gemmatimonadaceae bacterium]